MSAVLKACPFCGGAVELEQASESYSREHGPRKWWGIVCRNTINQGGTCAIQQIPSVSPEAAIARWNRRPAPKGALTDALPELPKPIMGLWSPSILKAWEEQMLAYGQRCIEARNQQGDAVKAARYDWLTQRPGFIRPHLNGQPVYVNFSGTKDELDAAIDAAIEQRKADKNGGAS